MLIVMGKSENRTPREADSSFFSAGNAHNSASGRTGLVEVLSELRNLLEDYSPAWYTEKHQRGLESALHRVCL